MRLGIGTALGRRISLRGSLRWGWLWCLGLLVLPAWPQSRNAKPDVILVTIDTLRADHVGCYGYKAIQTPALDRLCAGGVRFDQAYTPVPLTNSSHASIFTGLYPSSHGVTDFGMPLAASHVTMAELFHRHGYQTAAFIGAVILDSHALAPGFERGFDTYDNFPEHPPADSRWGRLERRGEEVVRRANAWLASSSAKPRFLWVHLYDPHDPYQPPAPYATVYKGHLYDGEIAYADHALGQLLALLDQQGRYDNSLIIVMGDHGEGLGEHGEDTHGIFLYDSTMRVPLIVKLPSATGQRLAKGRVVSAAVRTIDVLPTLANYLGFSTPAKFDGESFREFLFSGGEAARPATTAGGQASSSGKTGGGETASGSPTFGETDYPIRYGWSPLKSVRGDGLKYIEAPRPELYDLRADPKEQRNLYQPWDERVKTLRSELADFRERSPSPASAPTAPVDPQTIAELKALGYLGNVAGATTAPEPSMLPDAKDKIAIHNLIHRGMLEEEDGRADVAADFMSKAVAMDQGSVVALSELGRLTFKAGKYKAAAQYLSRAFQLRPQDVNNALTLGEALEKTGDLAAARDVLEATVKSAPGQYSARAALGRIYLGLNNLAAAQDQLEAATLIDSAQPAAHITLARVFKASRQMQPALEQLRLAEKADPGNKEVKELRREWKIVQR